MVIIPAQRIELWRYCSRSASQDLQILHATDCPQLCPGPNCVDTLQEAVDAAAANAPAAQVIGIFIKTEGNAVISAAQDLRIEQCRNAKITAEDPLLPVLHIQSTAGDGDPTNNVHPTTKDIFIHGPDFIDGSVGIQVDNNSTEVKGIRALNNTFGILVTGNNNIINGSNGDQSDFAGIRVTGNNNTVRNSKALNNGNSGFEIVGAGNLVRANTAEGNGIDGFFVAGGAVIRSRTIGPIKMSRTDSAFSEITAR